MPTKREQDKAAAAYRKAAMKLYGLSREEAEKVFVPAYEDRGEWAPGSLVVVCHEYAASPPEIGYYGPNCFDECIRLSSEAKVGWMEYQNAAVSAVWQ